MLNVSSVGSRQVFKLPSPNSIEGAFKSARYCAQGNNILQSKKASGKQAGALGISTVSKGEISQIQEVLVVSSEKRKNMVNSGILQEQTNVKALYYEGVKVQSLQEAKGDVEQVKWDEESPFVQTVVKSEEVLDEGKERIQDSPAPMGVSVHAIEGAYNNRTITLTGKNGNKEFFYIGRWRKYSQLP